MEMRLRRARVAGRSFAAALTYLSTAASPLAPTAKHLGVGLRPPCRGQACGGVLKAIWRAFPPPDFCWIAFLKPVPTLTILIATQAGSTHAGARIFNLACARLLLNFPVARSVAAFLVNSEPHTGACPLVRL